jgi:hypothetical protein
MPEAPLATSSGIRSWATRLRNHAENLADGPAESAALGWICRSARDLLAVLLLLLPPAPPVEAIARGSIILSCFCRFLLRSRPLVCVCLFRYCRCRRRSSFRRQQLPVASAHRGIPFYVCACACGSDKSESTVPPFTIMPACIGVGYASPVPQGCFIIIFFFFIFWRFRAARGRASRQGLGEVTEVSAGGWRRRNLSV